MDVSPPLSPHKLPGAAYRAILDRLARVGALFIVGVGTAVMVGWVLDIGLLKSLLPGLATMKVNTACAFIAVGVSLRLLAASPRGSWPLRVARGLACLAIIVGILSLAEDALSADFGIDELIMTDDRSPAQTLSPGRMSPATALNFIFIGLTLLCLKARSRRLAAWAQWLVGPALVISTLAILGYAYGANALLKVTPYTTMSMHTAFSFLVLSLCIIAADSEHGFARIATSETAGGVVSRMLLPTLPIVLFLLGSVGQAGQRAGYYDFAFGLALMVLLSIAVCVIAVSSTATTLHRTDLARMRREAEIVGLNVELERRVEERTQKLDAANKLLEHLALEDGLTHLPNRRSFDAHLDTWIAVARRHQRTVALILYDVDSFKAYNDSYGHQAGDECLTRIAAAIESCCRRPADMAARYGGEEFAMILPETGLEAATQLAEAARDAVANLKIPHGHSATAPYVSISGGVAAICVKDGADARQLIAAADKSLYQAKLLGRNRIVSAEA